MNYHDRPEISASKLKSLLNGSGTGLAWREYEARYVTRTIPPIETSKAMEWGNVVETVLLEPLKVQKRVYVGPSKDQFEDLLVTMDDLRHYCERWSIKPGKTKAATVAAFRAVGRTEATLLSVVAPWAMCPGGAMRHKDCTDPGFNGGRDRGNG